METGTGYSFVLQCQISRTLNRTQNLLSDLCIQDRTGNLSLVSDVIQTRLRFVRPEFPPIPVLNAPLLYGLHGSISGTFLFQYSAPGEGEYQYAWW